MDDVGQLYTFVMEIRSALLGCDGRNAQTVIYALHALTGISVFLQDLLNDESSHSTFMLGLELESLMEEQDRIEEDLDAKHFTAFRDEVRRQFMLVEEVMEGTPYKYSESLEAVIFKAWPLDLFPGLGCVWSRLQATKPFDQRGNLKARHTKRPGSWYWENSPSACWRRGFTSFEVEVELSKFTLERHAALCRFAGCCKKLNLPPRADRKKYPDVPRADDEDDEGLKSQAPDDQNVSEVIFFDIIGKIRTFLRSDIGPGYEITGFGSMSPYNMAQTTLNIVNQISKQTRPRHCSLSTKKNGSHLSVTQWTVRDKVLVVLMAFSSSKSF
ncbi:hypothetical protein B0H67DRAFT_642769 [Lasiosphaeris hirsuta]|uniref:Uncharacterized protein n=1 Tax=Lasiosphaeris hirsuta TaxID=260670 RepID=A0AA40AP36_9PEZI|nr:hypothetical protein B0H67DRAFT_642769 [Lasiosphaeris hirsuta]